MTMRFPPAFILSRLCVVTGLRSSAMSHRQRDELGNLPEPEVPVGELRVRDGERGGVHGAIVEPHDVEIQGARPPAYTGAPPPPGPAPPPPPLPPPPPPYQGGGGAPAPPRPRPGSCGPPC